MLDEYVGGIFVGYVVNLAKLKIDKQRIGELLEMGETLKAGDGPSEGSWPVRSDHLIEDKLGPTKYSLAQKGSPVRETF